MTVTIKNKKIVKIHIDSAPGETTSFFNRAKTLTDLMIRQQSTETGNCFQHVLLSGECFACGKCAERCPRRNAERPFPGKYLKSK